MPKISRTTLISACFSALFLLASLAGCLHAEVPPRTIVVRIPEGVPVSYVLHPEWEGMTNTTWSLTATHADAGLTIESSVHYAGRSEKDHVSHGTVAATGAWRGVDFPCAPMYPTNRTFDGVSSSLCNRTMAGSGRWLPDGPFFDMLMISGLQPVDGVVETSIPLGDFAAPARFNVDWHPDGTATIYASDEATRNLYWNAIRSPMDPFNDCSILVGIVTFDTVLGLPTSCIKPEPDEGEAWGWRLAVPPDTSTTKAFHARPLSPVPSTGDARFPRDGGPSAYGFTFEEALQASRADARVARIVDAPDTFVPNAYFRSGYCAVAVQLLDVCTEWAPHEWSIDIQQGGQAWEAIVTKPSGPDGGPASLAAVNATEAVPVPKTFAAQLPPMSMLWDKSSEWIGMSAEGIRAIGFTVQGPREPHRVAMTTISFSPEGGAGFIRDVWFWSNGEPFLSYAGPLP